MYPFSWRMLVSRSGNWGEVAGAVKLLQNSGRGHVGCASRVEVDELLMVNDWVSCAAGDGGATRAMHVRPGLWLSLSAGTNPLSATTSGSFPRSPSTFTTQIRPYAFAGHSGNPQEKRFGWFLWWDLPPSQFFPGAPPRFVSSAYPLWFCRNPR